jgi:hypothetical protein
MNSAIRAIKFESPDRVLRNPVPALTKLAEQVSLQALVEKVKYNETVFSALKPRQK